MARDREPEQDYVRELNRLVDAIYQDATDRGWSWIDLAGEAGVAVTTVYHLGERQTRFPEFRTVFRLAAAVGMQLQLQKVAKLKRAA